MGGRVGLKGTDGVVARARELGAAPIANARALEMLRELARLRAGAPGAPAIEWLTAAGEMGGDALQAAGLAAAEIVHRPAGEPSARDTAAAVEAFLARHVDLVLFCGGDGTARDICALTGETTPVLGIPAGVKMYSGVFGVTPARTAELLWRWLAHEIGLARVDIVDLDEDKYRRDEWAVRLYLTASAPFEPTLVQSAKALVAGRDEDAVKDDIAAQLRDEIAARPGTLFLLGPGSTVQAVARALQVDKTLLGIDAVVGGRPHVPAKWTPVRRQEHAPTEESRACSDSEGTEYALVGADLAEREILALIDRYPDCRLVLSPIGAQGFVLGRGNQQLSPAIIRRIGAANILVLSTPAKLARTPVLRFDTGDANLDSDMISRKFFEVIVGYRRTRLVRVAG
jgi:predicted polyphosphate/ATP-dependent NAD kinase